MSTSQLKSIVSYSHFSSGSAEPLNHLRCAPKPPVWGFQPALFCSLKTFPVALQLLLKQLNRSAESLQVDELLFVELSLVGLRRSEVQKCRSKRQVRVSWTIYWLQVGFWVIGPVSPGKQPNEWDRWGGQWWTSICLLPVLKRRETPRVWGTSHGHMEGAWIPCRRRRSKWREDYNYRLWCPGLHVSWTQ